MFKSQMSNSILSLENYHLLSKYKDRILAAEDLSKPSSPPKENSDSRYLDTLTESKKREQPIRTFKLREGRITIPSIEEIEAELRQTACANEASKKPRTNDRPVLSTRNMTLNKKFTHEFNSPQFTQMSTNRSEGVLLKNCASQTIEDSEIRVITIPEVNLKGSHSYNRLVTTINDTKGDVPTKDENIKETAKTERSVHKEENKSKFKLKSQNIRGSRNISKKAMRIHTKERKKANTYRIPNKQLLQKTSTIKKTKQFTFNSLWELVKEHADKCAEFKTLLTNKGFL